MRAYRLIGFALALAATPAWAQLRSPQTLPPAAERQDEESLPPPQQQQQQTPLEMSPGARTARSSVGQAGQRQTLETAAEEAGIRPMARIANRIPNRVQNRIRNRIDRYYNPQGNAADPFTVAGEQARTTGRPR